MKVQWMSEKMNFKIRHRVSVREGTMHSCVDQYFHVLSLV